MSDLAIRGRKTQPGSIASQPRIGTKKGQKLVKFVQFVAEKPNQGASPISHELHELARRKGKKLVKFVAIRGKIGTV